MEYINTDRAINDYLADYQESSSQFKSTVDTYLAAVLPKIEDAIRSKTGLSEADTNTALEKASSEIARTTEFFRQHGDDIHPLILEKNTCIECE